MYKIILSALILMSTSTQTVLSQTVKEKMKAKMTAAKKELNKMKGAETSDVVLDNFVSLDSIAGLWVDGSYSKIVRGASTSWESGGISLVAEYIKFVKNEYGKVDKIYINNNDIPYTAMHTDITSWIWCYKRSGYLLYLTPSSIIEYSTDDRTIMILWGTKKNRKACLKEINDFRDYTNIQIKKQELAYDEEQKRLKAERIAKEKAHFDKYSIKNKKVVSIAISRDNVLVDDYFIGLDNKYGVIAKLNDDSYITTKNAGGEGYDYEDYTWYNSSEPKFGEKGKMKLKVCSSYDNSLCFEKTVNVIYPSSLNLYYSGRSGGNGGDSRETNGGDGGSGGDGGNVTVYLRNATHSETGKKLTEAKVVHRGTAKYYTLQADADILIECQGGKGGDGGGAYSSGTRGGNGGSGGDGGTITVIFHPNFTNKKNIKYNINGGRTGFNGPGYSNASAGGHYSGGSVGSYTSKTESFGY